MPHSAAPSPNDPGSLIDTQTHAHLETLFRHDAEASRLSERFARIAEIEGFPEAARVLREIGQMQAFQAQGHLDLLTRARDPQSGHAMGPTSQNLRAVMAAHVELIDPLADMANTARAEGFVDVASWFETLARTRRAHAARVGALLDAAEPPPS